MKRLKIVYYVYVVGKNISGVCQVALHDLQMRGSGNACMKADHVYTNCICRLKLSCNDDLHCVTATAGMLKGFLRIRERIRVCD